MGRLDRQKGIDRLYGCIAQLRDHDAAFTAVIVGGEILADAPSSWSGRLRELGCDVRAPVFGSKGLANLLAWGDVLVMPSRWEGAPLMIAEAQQLGCVPVATAVGAVGELITDGEDGLLVDQQSDPEIIEHLAKAVLGVARDPECLRRLAEGCLRTASGRSWSGSFSAFLDWCQVTIPGAKPRAAEPARGGGHPATAQTGTARTGIGSVA
jgi:glycosyltransferase involved in cell wall biosynthesis